MKYWYVNGATGEIDSYNESDGITDLPRGVFLAYGDALTTGLKSKEDAEKWLKDWECIRTVNVGGFRRPTYRWEKREETEK